MWIRGDQRSSEASDDDTVMKCALWCSYEAVNVSVMIVDSSNVALKFPRGNVAPRLHFLGCCNCCE